MPPRNLFRLGLGFLFLALTVYAFSEYWLKSRVFVPLDVPVNLDTNQLRSLPFQINLRETYFVALWLDDSVDEGYDDGRCNSRALLGSQWRVYRLTSKPGQPRQLWESSGEMTAVWEYDSDRFDASSGRYELEWDLHPAACLNARHPRLVVYTGDEDYRQAAAFCESCCIFIFGTGLVLLTFAIQRASRHIFTSHEVPRMFPEMVLRNVMSVSKHAPLPLIHNLPHWPLFFSVLWSILIFIFMSIAPFPSKGLSVSWKNHDVVVWEKSPWPQTLEVYVGAPARFFINDEKVERGDLRTKLSEQLRHRAEWTVYFEADPDTSFVDTVYAIDTIQTCGAKLVWITPKMREDWRDKSSSVRDTPLVRAQ